MSAVTRSSTAGIDTATAMIAPQLTGLYAGEDLGICAPCYIKASDGKVNQSNGTAANEAAKFFGFTPRAVKSGQPVTLYGNGTRMGYAASGLAVGAKLYIGTTAGALDTAATTGDAVGVAVAISATEIVCNRNIG